MAVNAQDQIGVDPARLQGFVGPVGADDDTGELAKFLHVLVQARAGPYQGHGRLQIEGVEQLADVSSGADARVVLDDVECVNPHPRIHPPLRLMVLFQVLGDSVFDGRSVVGHAQERGFDFVLDHERSDHHLADVLCGALDVEHAAVKNQAVASSDRGLELENDAGVAHRLGVQPFHGFVALPVGVAEADALAFQNLHLAHENSSSLAHTR